MTLRDDASEDDGTSDRMISLTWLVRWLLSLFRR